MSTHHEPTASSIGGLNELASGLNRVLDSWLAFWFKPTELTTLALIRICAGLLALYNLFIYSYDLQALMGKDAWLDHQTVTAMRKESPIVKPWTNWSEPQRPAENPEDRKYLIKWGYFKHDTYVRGMPVWSVWFHVTNPGWMVVVHVAIILATVCFTVGFCTRVMGVAVWVGTVSYIQRAQSTLFGQDTMMNILLFYLMIAGLLGAAGGALSVDRLLMRYWARRRGLSGRLAEAAPSQLAVVSGNFVTRLLQVHFCIIYLSSGLSKLQGAAWWNGTALWWVMINPEFNPLGLKPYLGFVTFLSKHRVLWELFMTGGTLFTLVLEIGFPFLVWNRKLRWLMVIGAVWLHTGIALTMGLVGFSLAMLTMLLSFVPPETVRRMLGVLKEQARPLLDALGLPRVEPALETARA
jgi:hypothetical protein